MRSHYCGQIDETLLQQQVTLCGWVHRRRDHGGIIFLDLRDRSGIAQIVVDPATPKAFTKADQIRNEYVICVKGEIRFRPEGTQNRHMPTGMVELIAAEVTILNKALTPPFQLDDYSTVNEEIRLKYRYLDLRRPEMMQRLFKRAEIIRFVRHYLEDLGFVDIDTPLLTRATPEGARDYLVPSRTHAGHFFALPQSPQLFKQLLMYAGFDRYYQIAKCFRDEDLRADRQPEFTQIDIEASFVDETDIMKINEGLVRELFAKVLSVTLPHFPQMSYSEAMHRFGSDKPDLRIPLELVDVTELMQQVDFAVFAEPAKNANGRVAILKVPQGGQLSRKQIDDYTRFVSQYGAKGLAWIKVIDPEQGLAGLQSPIVKYLTPVIEQILIKTAAKAGDLLFFGADQAKIVNAALGALRVEIGKDLQLYTQDWAPLWVTHFPMFEEDDQQQLSACHHPFTAPDCSISELQNSPLKALSRAYDMVLNGIEIGGGSIRIHDPVMQKAVFNILGIDDQQAQDKFGFLLTAMQYGVPPHGGIAFGLDRLVMLMVNAKTIRDVMAFPKTQSAADLMTEAPGQVNESQLRELHIRLRQPSATQ